MVPSFNVIALQESEKYPEEMTDLNISFKGRLTTKLDHPDRHVVMSMCLIWIEMINNYLENVIRCVDNATNTLFIPKTHLGKCATMILNLAL